MQHDWILYFFPTFSKIEKYASNENSKGAKTGYDIFCFFFDYFLTDPQYFMVIQIFVTPSFFETQYFSFGLKFVFGTQN